MDKCAAPYFINVDFELQSSFDLASLADGLGECISVLGSERVRGRYLLNFEMVCSESISGLSSIISEAVSLIDGLPAHLRREFDCCEVKVADIGFNSGETGWYYGELPNSVISSLASLGFSIKFSVYGLSIAEGVPNNTC